MQSKYHIHIYKVRSLVELDVMAGNSNEAKEKAIEIFRHNKHSPKKPDTEFVILDWEADS